MVDVTFQAQAVEWQGLPAIDLSLAQGDAVRITLQGAQVLSWVSGGEERMFLSPQAAHDGKTAIRGGIPVCFPQFNQRGPLVKHGFARTMPWVADAAQPLGADGVQLTLRLSDTEATRAVWPHAFEATLTVQLRPGQLRVALAVHNRGPQVLPFTAALHSYLRVPHGAPAQLWGLQGIRYWDAAAPVPDTFCVQSGAVALGAEVDRVYPRAAGALELRSGDRPWLRIAQDSAWLQTVVWNPGPLLCATLGDMQADSWRHMLCVEAASIDEPVTIAPGQHWQAAQQFTAH